MIRKIALPVVFFIFGIFVYFIETLMISWLLSIEGLTSNSINLFNLIFFILVVLLLLFFEVIPNFKKMKDNKIKYPYLVVTMILLAASATYWVRATTWK